MKRQLSLALILLFILHSISFAENRTFDVGALFSTWGTGIQGNYYFSNEILFGGDFISGSEVANYSNNYGKHMNIFENSIHLAAKFIFWNNNFAIIVCNFNK